MSDSEAADDVLHGGEEPESSFTLPRTTSLSAAKFTSQEEDVPPGFEDQHKMNGTAERQETLNGRTILADTPPVDERMPTPPAEYAADDPVEYAVVENDSAMDGVEEEGQPATAEEEEDEEEMPQDPSSSSDEAIVPISPPTAASPNRYLIDKKTLPLLLQLADQLKQQRISWCNPLPLPNNVLIATLDQVSDIIRNGLDLPGSEAETQVAAILEHVMLPVFERICRDETGMNTEDMKNMMSCIFRFLVIFVNKLHKCAQDGPLPRVYWILFHLCTEYNNRFFTRVSQYQMNAILPIVPGDLTLPSPIIRKIPQPQNQQWFIATIVWFHKLRGFDALVTYFHSRVDGSSPFEEIAPFIECISGYLQFLDPRFIRTTLDPVLDVVMCSLEAVTEDVWTKQSFIEFRDCPTYKMAQFVRTYLNYGRAGGDIDGDYDKAKKAAQLKLLFLKKCVLLGSFNVKMCAMDDLCRMLQMDEDIVDMNGFDLQAWIRQIELVETLFKDNLHHLAYIERLNRAVNTLLDRSVLGESFLDILWQAQQGKHDVIQRNMQHIIAKVVVVFNNDLLDAFWKRITDSWMMGSYKEKETVVDLLRRVGLENFNHHDHTLIKFHLVEQILKLLWDWSTEPGFDGGLRRKIYECIVDVLQETVASPRGLAVLSRMCLLVAKTAAVSNEQVANAEDPTGLCLTLTRRILELFSEGDPRYGEYSNKRSAMLKKLDNECRTERPDPSTSYDFAFGKLIVNGICTFVDEINFESIEAASMCSDSSMDSECSSVDSSEDELQSQMVLAALRTRLEFVEFLLQIVQRSQDYDANPFENEWAKTLWNKLINTKQPQKLQNVGFGFFASMISWSDVMEHGDSFIIFFREKVMSVEPNTLSMMGFQCFEAFMRVANIVLNKMRVDTVHIGTAEEKEYHLIEPDFEGEDYLRKAVVFGTDKVFHMASALLVKLWAVPVQDTNEGQEIFVSQVVAKFTTWLSEVESDNSEVGKNCRDLRIRRVLQTINDIVDRNETDSRLIHRAYPILRRAIIGKGFRINVVFKVEDMQLLFPDQRVPMSHNKPLVLTVHENMLLFDLVKHICGVITNQGGTITPYALMLVRKGGAVPGGNSRFGNLLRLGDWSQTLKELQIEENTHLVARADKSRVGNDGSDNDFYLRQISDEWCHRMEKKMYAYQLINDEELMNRIVALGNDCELIEACTRLFCSIPMAKIGDFDRTEPWEAKVQRFKKSLAELMEEQSSSRRLCGFLQLYEALLPATLPYKNNSDTLTAFFAASGPTALIKMFSQYADLECLDELSVLNCDVLLRLLPPLVFLFVSAVGNKLESRISDAALDFFANAKRNADCFVQDVGKMLNLPPDKDELLNEMVMDVNERDLYAYLHIGMKFMHDTARSCVLSTLLDVPLDPETLLDPMADDPDKMVSACVYVFAILCSYSVDGFTVLGSPIFHNFMLECCTEEESCTELFMMVPELLCEVAKDRESTALLEAAIAFLFEHLDTQNLLFWDIICSLIEKYTELAVGDRLPHLSERVDEMVNWLDAVQKQTEEQMCHYPAQHLLRGRLKLAATLFTELDSTEKFELGVADGGSQLVERLLYNFLVPSSRAFAQKLWHEGNSRIVRSQTLMETLSPNNEMDTLSAVPRSTSTCVLPISTVSVCKSDYAQRNAYDVLKILCENPECLAQLVKLLKELFYTDRTLDDVIWDYQPDYSLRQADNFVGLKNGGATCYMNSILQQLYMISQMRDTILNANVEEDREDMPYETRIVGALQSVFAHLAGSELEAYTPDEFWRIFKLNERIVNVHEQQDAFEFFNMVVDLIDEGMDKIGSPKIGSQVFGGLFADEKICKDCPHKYSRDEPFTSISIDMRSHNNIIDSLHEFVKGDVLENDNAYHCENCNKKVRAVKRLSIKKLPANLVVQLKRFEFDWEKNEPVKFNDYFEFPFSLDMRPYTADALNALDEAGESPSSPTPLDSDCQYNLRGVLVHSGQATGGHYFSYIRNDDGKWFKFDDNDVSVYECDQRDVKYKWFGDDPNSVDYTGRRRGRIWWNAFLLFYEKVSTTTLVDRNLATLLPSIQPPVIPMSPLSVDPLLAQAVVDSSRRSSTASPVTRLHKRFSTMSLMSNRLRNVPPRLEKQVRNQNTRIMHERNEYNSMYFGFVTSLVKHHLLARHLQQANVRNEDVFLLLTELYSNFLIYTCLHSSTLLRKETEYDAFQSTPPDLFNSRFDWCDAIVELIKSKHSRLWFISNVVLSESATRTYCINAKDTEIRVCYARMICRLLETTFLEGDTIADLLDYPSPHLQRVMQPKYTRDLLQPVIQLLADTLTALTRSYEKLDKIVGMYDLIVNIIVPQRVNNGIFVPFVRAGLLSNLMRLLEACPSPFLHIPAIHVKFCSLMLRCVDLTGPHPDRLRNPFLILPADQTLTLNDMADGLVVARDIENWKLGDGTVHSRWVEFMVLTMWDQPEFEWMRQTVCFLCWNNRDIANRLLNFAVRLTLQDRHSSHTELGLQMIHAVCNLPDDNHDNGRRFKYLFNEVPFVYNNDPFDRRDYSVGVSDLYGLRSIVYIVNGHKRDTLLRALIMVLEAHEERAIQYLKQHDRTRFEEILSLTRMEPVRKEPNPTIGHAIPNILNAKLRMTEFVSRFQEAPDEPSMDESMEEDDDFSSESGNEMEQPLDLTLGRNAATTPQAAEKRTLPAHDDTDSLNGEGEAKKLRIVSAENVSVVDDEKLLTSTSVSATDVREKNSQNPPPGYTET